MRIVTAIARILMGLVFVVFGANLLFPFIRMPEMPPGPQKDFNTALWTTHYIWVVGVCQLVPGLLLLINRYVPLALTVLAAMLVNILSTHIFIMHGEGLQTPLVVVVLWMVVFWSVRDAFAGIFEARPARRSTTA